MGSPRRMASGHGRLRDRHRQSLSRAIRPLSSCSRARSQEVDDDSRARRGILSPDARRSFPEPRMGRAPQRRGFPCVPAKPTSLLARPCGHHEEDRHRDECRRHAHQRGLLEARAERPPVRARRGAASLRGHLELTHHVVDDREQKAKARDRGRWPATYRRRQAQIGRVATGPGRRPRWLS